MRRGTGGLPRIGAILNVQRCALHHMEANVVPVDAMNASCILCCPSAMNVCTRRRMGYPGHMRHAAAVLIFSTASDVHHTPLDKKR